MLASGGLDGARFSELCRIGGAGRGHTWEGEFLQHRYSRTYSNRSMPPALTLQDVELRLRKTALERVDLLGFQLAPVCETYLRSFIRGGIQTMGADGSSIGEDRIKVAEASLERFVSEMAIEAKRLCLTTLHEPTFLYARARICPLWPFC